MAVGAVVAMPDHESWPGLLGELADRLSLPVVALDGDTDDGSEGGRHTDEAVSADPGDDDTVPEPGALEALLAARERATTADEGPPTLAASRVVWTDGRDHPMNTPRPKPRATAAETRIARAAGCVPIRSASFVSVLVDAAAVRERGLPVADYFLWNEIPTILGNLVGGLLFTGAAIYVTHYKTAPSRRGDKESVTPVGG